MRGFTKSKYTRIMDKLYLDRPMNKATLVVRTNTQAPYNVLQITNLPCMVNILSSGSVWNPKYNLYEVSSKIEIIIQSKYFKDKKFPDNQTLVIPRLLATLQNGGYPYVVFSLSPTTTDKNAGYILSDLAVTYGEYEDGGYGEYIKFVIIKSQQVV